MIPCRRQLHVWVTEADHAFLTSRAVDNDTTVGALVRALIRRATRDCAPPKRTAEPLADVSQIPSRS